MVTKELPGSGLLHSLSLFLGTLTGKGGGQACHSWKYQGKGHWACETCPMQVYAIRRDHPEEWLDPLFEGKPCKGKTTKH